MDDGLTDKITSAAVNSCNATSGRRNGSASERDHLVSNGKGSLILIINAVSCRCIATVANIRNGWQGGIGVYIVLNIRVSAGADELVSPGGLVNIDFEKIIVAVGAGGGSCTIVK